MTARDAVLGLLLALGGAFCRPAPASTAAAAPPSPARAKLPAACDRPWNLDVVGGDGQAVVVCPGDVRREAVGASPEIAGALAPALDPVRDRVCSCAARLTPPEFVDLLFTGRPEEGVVTVEASGGDDLDPDLGPPFVACVGTVAVRMASRASTACADAGPASFKYPVRLDLAPPTADR